MLVDLGNQQLKKTTTCCGPWYDHPGPQQFPAPGALLGRSANQAGQLGRGTRDLAMFNLAICSKGRGYHAKLEDVAPQGQTSIVPQRRSELVGRSVSTLSIP